MRQRVRLKVADVIVGAVKQAGTTDQASLPSLGPEGLVPTCLMRATSITKRLRVSSGSGEAAGAFSSQPSAASLAANRHSWQMPGSWIPASRGGL